MSNALSDGYLVAYSQLPDEVSGQTDSISLLENECVVLSTGVVTLPHSDVASQFATETALWCYRHVRQRPYYWEDKGKLIERIFRTTNLSLWQKRKEPTFSEGLACTLSVVLLGVRKIWIGSIGSSDLYLIREGLVDDLMYTTQNSGLPSIQALGFARSGAIPGTISETIVPGDVLIISSASVSRVVTEDDIRIASEETAATQESCMKCAVFLLEKALERGSKGSKTVCVIKKM